MFGFEKLDEWKKSIELADDVHRLTRECPNYEKYGLANQMRRAAVSISSNIAEGSSRGSRRDYRRFIEIAYGSTMELVSQIHIAQRPSFIPTEAARGLYRKADEIGRMFSGLKASIKDEA